MISMLRFAEPGSPMPAWTDGIENAENRINPARMTGIWNEIALKEGIGSTNPQVQVPASLFHYTCNWLKFKKNGEH